MNVEEAIELAPELVGDLMLMARPPLTWGSEAIYVQIDESLSGIVTARNEGFQSLLDLEEIQRLRSALESKQLSAKSKAEFLIHYALYDSYPAWFDDLPRR